MGVDIGGSWIRSALFDGTYTPVRRNKRKTEGQRAAEKIVADIVRCIKCVTGRSDWPSAAIGIGVPTTIGEDGRLESCDNLPTMNRFPLRQALEERLDHNVIIENDANCFALGEWLFGAGRDSRLMVCVTLGTGVGLGIIHEGKIFRGASGRAGEVWRSPANLKATSDGNRSVESLVGGRALESAYFGICGEMKRGEEIAAIARQSDKVALGVFRSFGRHLGRLLRWLSDILDPDLLVLGGSVAKSADLFLKELIGVSALPEKKIRVSQLGDLAPLLGAAALSAENQIQEGCKDT